MARFEGELETVAADMGGFVLRERGDRWLYLSVEPLDGPTPNSMAVPPGGLWHGMQFWNGVLWEGVS